MHIKQTTPDQLNQILSEQFQKSFWSKVQIGGPDECWLWTRRLNRKGGYGFVDVCQMAITAHRVAWIIQNKCDVPEGLEIRHSCIASKTCCNPAHLTPGTHTQNMHDMINQGRHVVPEGEKNGMSKLTEVQVLKIRELYASGDYYQKELGEMFGVSQCLIWYIVHRKWWKHI